MTKTEPALVEITQSQLSSKLKQHFPVYIVTGDTRFLCDEAHTALITALKKKGYDAHERLQVDARFDVADFYEKTHNQSLFAEKTLVDMRFEKSRVEKSIVTAWTEFLDSKNPDVVLVIRLPKLTQAQKKSKWHQMMSKTGLIITVKPIYSNAWLGWIKERMNQANLTAEPDAYQLLADFTEGNLYAAHQAIQKLALLHPKMHLHYQQISQAVTIHSRYSVFDLTREALLGNLAAVKRMMCAFKKEDTEATLLLWALCQEIRSLIQCHHNMQHGSSIERELRNVWTSRQQQMRLALQRTDLSQLKSLLTNAHQIDLCIKGLSSGNYWQQLTHLALALSGKSLCTH